MAKTATPPKKAEKNAATAVAEVEDPSLDRVNKDYTDFHTYISPYWIKWEKYWKLWDNVSVDPQYDGDNMAFDPMVFQVVETLVDNVYGSRPKLTFLATRKDQEVDTKILKGLWDFSWDKSNMDDVIPIFGREVIITGNGCIFPCWEDGYMGMRHIPIKDCILDISAADPTQWRFAGYRRLALIEDLKKEKRFDPQAGAIDPDDGKPKGAWVPRYNGLEEIIDTGTNGDITDKQLKEQIYAGSTMSTDGKKGQVEVRCMFYMDKIIETANRAKTIFEDANPYFKEGSKAVVQLRNEKGEPLYDETDLPEGAEFMTQDELEVALTKEMIEVDIPAIEPFIPCVMHRGFVDRAVLIAKGDVEPIANTQGELNDMISAKRDNIIYNVQNVVLIDEGSKAAIPELAQAKAGSIVSVKNLSQFGDRTVQWMKKPDMTSAADAEINRVKKSLRDTVRVAETAQGVDTSGGDRTATEINAQVAQSSGSFAAKVKALESGMYKQLGEMFVKMVQIFLTEDQLVRIVGKDGVEFKQFQPGDYWGPYDVKVVLEEKAKAQAKEEADQAVEAYAQFKMDPDFNQLELKKMVARKAFGMDDDDLDLLLSPNAGQNAPQIDPATGQPIDPGPAQGGLPAGAGATLPAGPPAGVRQPAAGAAY